MAKFSGFKSDLTQEMIPDDQRVQGRLTFIYGDGRRVEARFDLAEGEEHIAKDSIPDHLFQAVKAPGPAKGTTTRRKRK